MEHIELHVMKSSHDVELAMIAGLLDEFEDTAELACSLCEQLISLTGKADGNSALILISESTATLSCESCLTSSLESVMVT